MAEYRRFIAYIYEYVNGMKGNNVGFVKVESRNGICRLQIHLQQVPKEETSLYIDGFARTRGSVGIIPLGICGVGEGAAEYKMSTPHRSFGNSDYSLDQIAGLFLEGENGAVFATVWDDGEVEIDDLKRFAENIHKKRMDQKGFRVKTGDADEAEERREEESKPDMEGNREEESQPGMEGNRKEESQPGMEGNRKEESKPDMEGNREEESRPGMEGNRKEESQPGMEGNRKEESQPGMEGNREEESQPGMEGNREEESQLGMEGNREEESQPGMEGDREEESQPGMKGNREEESRPGMKEIRAEELLSNKGERRKEEHRERESQPDREEHREEERQPEMEEHRGEERQPFMEEHREEELLPFMEESRRGERHPFMEEHRREERHPFMEEHRREERHPFMEEHRREERHPFMEEHRGEERHPLMEEHREEELQPFMEEHRREESQPEMEERHIRENQVGIEDNAGGGGPEETGGVQWEESVPSEPSSNDSDDRQGDGVEAKSAIPSEKSAAVHEGGHRGNPPGSRRQQGCGRINCPNTCLERKWEHFQCHYQGLDPFQDDEIVECVQIAPKDLMFLKREDQRFFRNQFLLQGYCNYHHLLIGRRKMGGFVLGVPGIYEDQERFTANMYGFMGFKMARTQEGQTAQFGYWLRQVH